jgi:hypothetical protein
MITKQDIIAQIDHFGKYEGEMKEHIDKALMTFSIPYCIYLAAKGTLLEAEMCKQIRELEIWKAQKQLSDSIFVMPKEIGGNVK